MKTINDELFRVENLEHTGNLIKANLLINPDCSIFKGHFPGQPVVPGACMLQLVKEVLESALEKSLQIRKAGNLKFIAMIDPLVTASVQLEIAYKLSEDLISITGKLSDGDGVYFKYSAVTACLIS